MNVAFNCSIGLNFKVMITFFIVEQNELNNMYMVHSYCNELPQCYAFKSKREANEAANHFNIIANNDFQKYFKGNISKLSFNR